MIRNHDAAFTDIFSFFLMHDYHLNSLNFVLTEDSHSVDDSHTLIQHVKVMMTKLQDVSKFTQMIMTTAQQLQEKYINKSQDSFEQYNVRDKV